MKNFLSIAALTVSLSAGSALAQQAPDTTQPPPSAPPAAPAQNEAAPAPDTPSPPPPGPRGGPPGNDWRADWRRGHRPPPPPPSKAARFRIEDGNVKIDVKCADDEPMKACADEVNQILDRLEGSSRDNDDYR